MKVITEAILRNELRNSQPECYYIPTGMILSPAGREYLQQRKIKILSEQPPKVVATEVPPMPIVSVSTEAALKPKFIDHETGAFYLEKPEHMTHLFGNVLIPKDHPRILFRGKLDSLQGLIVLDQALIHEGGGSHRLIQDMGNILDVLREIMRCDVLDEAFHNETIIGLTHAELRERSHNPMKFYNIKAMVLPDYTMGRDYALLNQLRTAIREAEVAAVQAFRVAGQYTHKDIVEEFNRLSSAMHIMMCMYLAGEYKKGD